MFHLVCLLWVLNQKKVRAERLIGHVQRRDTRYTEQQDVEDGAARQGKKRKTSEKICGCSEGATCSGLVKQKKDAGTGWDGGR